MEQIPTVEDMEASGLYEDYTSMMIAFAKKHVEAALNAVSDKLEHEHVLRTTQLDNDFEFPQNCYPLTNIQ